MKVWEDAGHKAWECSVAGLYYRIVDYSWMYSEEGKRRRFTATVEHAGYFTSPKQTTLVGVGFKSRDDAKAACAIDMERRAKLLIGAAAA